MIDWVVWFAGKRRVYTRNEYKRVYKELLFEFNIIKWLILYESLLYIIVLLSSIAWKKAICSWMIIHLRKCNGFYRIVGVVSRSNHLQGTHKKLMFAPTMAFRVCLCLDSPNREWLAHVGRERRLWCWYWTYLPSCWHNRVLLEGNSVMIPWSTL